MSSTLIPQKNSLFLLVIIIVILNVSQTIAYPTSHLKNNSQRIFFNSKDELEVTRRPAVIAGKPCNAAPLAVFVHSSAQTSGRYYEKRSAIRKTWASDLIRHNISMYFAVGLNTNQSINEELVQESDTYKDILQFPFIDHYSNLTLKAVSILRWIKTYCLRPTHILKTDDDVMVNVESLLQNMSDLNNGFYGWLYQREMPPRKPDR